MKTSLIARAIIVYNHSILVNRHGDDIRFFGGHVKSAEKVQKALQRELQEELSLPVDVLHPLLVHDDIGKKKRVTTIYFDARILSNDPFKVEAKESHLEAHWLTANDIAFESIEPKRLRETLRRMIQPRLQYVSTR